MMVERVNLIIRAKMLIDGLGGQPVSRGLLAFAENKIVYAGTALDAPEFPGAQLLDLPEACLLPGLAIQTDGPIGFRSAVRQEIRAGADFFQTGQ
jgi:imidazolonepropionase-like amidohydrolase